MVKQASPTSSSGSTTPLLADAQDLSTTGSATPTSGSPSRLSPPGSGSTASALRLRTAASFGGTSNGPAVWRTANATSATAAESMTWSSGRPARTGTAAVGNFGSSGHDASLSTPVSGVGTGLVSFELAPESGDGLVFKSREDATSSSRLQLVLTITSG